MGRFLQFLKFWDYFVLLTVMGFWHLPHAAIFSSSENYEKLLLIKS